jgi:hypothetical protein
VWFLIASHEYMFLAVERSRMKRLIVAARHQD